MKWFISIVAEAPAEALEISPEERVLTPHQIRARSSAVERLSDKKEVDGSTPSVPTMDLILLRRISPTEFLNGLDGARPKIRD